MITEKIKVDGWGIGTDEVLDTADKFAEYEKLDEKTAMRIHLLAEEMIGMVTAIAEDFNALFWIESKGDTAYMHLMADTDMDYSKKLKLIDASKHKKNEAGVGIMGKIREIVENSIYAMDEIGALQMEQDGQSLLYSSMGMNSEISSADYMWSLESYRNSVEARKDDDSISARAWDELEKSIVANIADDVKVSVKGNKVELVIEKSLR